MLLVLDIGNTQTSVGLYDGQELVATWRLTTIAERTEDELRLWLRGLFDLEGYDADNFTGACIASVVPTITEGFRRVTEQLTSGPVVVIGPGVRTGMRIKIDNPREVGADRVANALAARERYSSPVVVVDFGTSTNFDVVGLGGEYLGGAIAPGLAIATNALVSGTAALRHVEFAAPRSVIGKGTVEAIQSGVIYGHAGLVDGIMERLCVAVTGDVTRVATGGFASTIVPHCRSVGLVDETLTLDGLRMIFERNTEAE